MRLVNYKVATKDGAEFTTTNYAEAVGNGNRVSEVFLTDVKGWSEAREKEAEEHRRKVDEYFASKRG